MRMVVAVTIMAVMVMACGMPTGVSRIGPALGIERRLDLHDARAQSLRHRFDHMVAPDSEAPCGDLGRQMTIAKMPGDTDQMMRIAASNFRQRLRGCNDLNQATILQDQSIATAQRRGVLQIKEKFKPAGADHRHAAPVPVIEIQHDGVGRGIGPAVLPMDFRSADHSVSFKTLPLVMISTSVGVALSGAEYSRQAFRCGALE